jgi:hypothetical protein
MNLKKSLNYYKDDCKRDTSADGLTLHRTEQNDEYVSIDLQCFVDWWFAQRRRDR